MSHKQILIVQTAFIGDVILASGLIEKLHQFYPEASIDFALRKGNESLLQNHPKLREVHIWDKKGGKYKNLFKLIGKIRSKKYDLVVNIQRFANSGMLTAFSGAKVKIGFDKNPFSWAFGKKIRHRIEEGVHEIERNNDLIKDLTDELAQRPALYPSDQDFMKVKAFAETPYICMAPASVWFTKQYPKEKWIELIKALPFDGNIYLLGAPGDSDLCEEIIEKAAKPVVQNLCGKISLLQSAALMKTAVISYVNDSAPMHLASSVNANTCAIYCSTVPEFGFGPLSDFAEVVEVSEKLDCRPCGLHGYKACPKVHFKCGFDINTQKLIEVFERANGV
ncbi:MAG: glycosyltransferase family 9 protein [Roseivirga sp.]|nr:glycosyltransferase family 9 protein [Roseivirga sp.]